MNSKAQAVQGFAVCKCKPPVLRAAVQMGCMQGQTELFGCWLFARNIIRENAGKCCKLLQVVDASKNRPRGYKTISMLNSAEHDFFLLINVNMPSVVGILRFMSRKIAFVEPEKKAELYIFLNL